MKGIFVFPPCFDPSMPYLAPYLLSTYVNEHFEDNISDVIDLNIIFYNNICKNKYLNFDNKMDVSSAVNFFYQIEHEMELDMKRFSDDNNVILSRQSLLFDFDRLNSQKVYNFLHENSTFSRIVTDLLQKNVDLNKYDFIGLNVTCQDQLVPAFIIAKYIKDFYDTKIILGGNIISRCQEGLIQSKLKQYFDFLIIKEGEYALCNVIRRLKNLDLLDEFKSNSIFACETNSIIDEVKSLNIVDINRIPVIRFDSKSLNKYFSPELVLPVFFSRGCSWGKCNFCGIHSSWNAKYRSKNPDQFCDELEFYIKTYGCRNFRLVDESPSIKDILSVANEIIKRNLNVNIEAYLNISKHLLDKKLVETLANAGIKQLFFGIESVSSKILSAMNKNINDPSFFKSILDNTSDCGIHNYAFFMIGYPGDNEKNEKELEKFIIQTLSLGTISISSFIPVIGTNIVSKNTELEHINVKYIPKGDLSNKCNYTINNLDVSIETKIRAKKIVETIMSERPDLKITSKLPYETRFFMCYHYGHNFGKEYLPSSNVVIDSSLNNEQKARVVRPE